MPCNGDAVVLTDTEAVSSAEVRGEREGSSEAVSPTDCEGAPDTLAEPDTDGDGEKSSGLPELETVAAGECDGGRGDAEAHAVAPALGDALPEREADAEAVLLALLAGLREGDVLDVLLREPLELERDDAVPWLRELERVLIAVRDAEVHAQALMLAAADAVADSEGLTLSEAAADGDPERVAPSKLLEAAADPVRSVADPATVALVDAVSVPEEVVVTDGELVSVGATDAVRDAAGELDRDCSAEVVAAALRDVVAAAGVLDAAALPEPPAEGDAPTGDADDEGEASTDAHALLLSATSDALAAALAEAEPEGESESEGFVLVERGDALALAVARAESLPGDALVDGEKTPDALAPPLVLSLKDASRVSVTVTVRVRVRLGQKVGAPEPEKLVLADAATLAVKDSAAEALAQSESDAPTEGVAAEDCSEVTDAARLAVAEGEQSALAVRDALPLTDALPLALLEGLHDAGTDSVLDALSDGEGVTDGHAAALREYVAESLAVAQRLLLSLEDDSCELLEFSDGETLALGVVVTTADSDGAIVGAAVGSADCDGDAKGLKVDDELLHAESDAD